MHSLIPTVIGLGLAIAVCSPVSVVTVIVVGLSHGQDFSSHKRTPFRAASIVEIVAGMIAILAAVRALRRRRGSRRRRRRIPK